MRPEQEEPYGGDCIVGQGAFIDFGQSAYSLHDGR